MLIGTGAVSHRSWYAGANPHRGPPAGSVQLEDIIGSAHEGRHGAGIPEAASTAEADQPIGANWRNAATARHDVSIEAAAMVMPMANSPRAARIQRYLTMMIRLSSAAAWTRPDCSTGPSPSKADAS